MLKCIFRWCLLVLLVGTSSLWALDDFGIDYKLDVSKRATKKLKFGLGGGVVTENGGSQLDRFKFTPYAEYEIFPWLGSKLAFRWTIDEKMRNTKPDYWRDLWQLRGDLTPSIKWGKFSFSWRVRGVWENRGWLELPDDLRLGTEIVSSFEIRNRLQALWRSPLWKLRPFVSTEVYTLWDDDMVESSPRVGCWAHSVGVKKKWEKRWNSALSLIWTSEWEDGIKGDEMTLELSQSLLF